jgi:hypothetical protein
MELPTPGRRENVVRTDPEGSVDRAADAEGGHPGHAAVLPLEPGLDSESQKIGERLAVLGRRTDANQLGCA